MRGGLIRGCKFTVDVRRDVFMYLFNGKGSRFKKGFMYDRSDFVNDFFPDDFFFIIINLASVVLLIFLFICLVTLSFFL